MPLRNIQPDQYQHLLAEKSRLVTQLYSAFEAPAVCVFASQPLGYRMRAEFRIWHENDDLYYAMFAPEDRKLPRRIDHFPIANPRIQAAMPALRQALLESEVLRARLFQVNFLATLSGELLITLIYHHRLDNDWEAAAQLLESSLQTHIIGRSRGQKVIISEDYLEEQLPLDDGEFRYRQHEGAFTQPNAGVNCAMINWACQQAGGLGGDLLELYCGNGNFTLPLAGHFGAVLATEVAKSSINAALHNCQLNSVENLQLARLSAQEVSAALAGDRPFRRLAQLPRSLQDYEFSTVFVDPPRAGLDPATTALVTQFPNILYISCNPQTQLENLVEINRTHEITALALFDQFPYTDHMECGVALRRRAIP